MSNSTYAALAFASNLTAGAEDHVGAVEADQLRDAQASLQGEHQQGSISSAFPASEIRSV